MPEAYIIDATRTPVGIGKPTGGYASAHPVDLGAHPIRTLVQRGAFDPAAVDDVIFGCLDTIGAQAGNIARNCALVAGLPHTVPGVTIDRQCGSSQQAVHFAAQAVMSGTADLILAGGVQVMSQYPIGSSYAAGEPYGAFDPWSSSPGWIERFGSGEVSQFASAERIASDWGLSRLDMEEFALNSHQRAATAQQQGRFDREITQFGGLAADEGPRPDTTLEKMARLKSLRADGQLTPAVSSQVSDGAAAILVASERAVKTHGLTPRARIHHLSVLGDDAINILTAPLPATDYALRRAGMAISDIDLYEVNEAFASVPMAWLKHVGADPDKLNVNGGAIALGHPLGASGARLMVTLLHELERTNGRYGLQTMCEGGGIANVTIIERL
ncbi:acetyl-CoA C-acetyltransferase [Nocardia sp. NPDC055029]